MKKTFSILAVVLMTLAMVACKKEQGADNKKPEEILPYTTGKDSEGNFIQIPSMSNKKVYYTTNTSDYDLDKLMLKVQEFYQVMKQSYYLTGTYIDGKPSGFYDTIRFSEQYITSSNFFKKSSFEYRMVVEVEVDKLRDISDYQFEFVNTERITAIAPKGVWEVTEEKSFTFEPYSENLEFQINLREDRWNESNLGVMGGDSWQYISYYFFRNTDILTAAIKTGFYTGRCNLLISGELPANFTFKYLDTLEVKHIDHRSITLFSSFFNTTIYGDIQNDSVILFREFPLGHIALGNQVNLFETLQVNDNIKGGTGKIQSYLDYNTKTYVPYMSYEFSFKSRLSGNIFTDVYDVKVDGKFNKMK